MQLSRSDIDCVSHLVLCLVVMYSRPTGLPLLQQLQPVVQHLLLVRSQTHLQLRHHHSSHCHQAVRRSARTVLVPGHLLSVMTAASGGAMMIRSHSSKCRALLQRSNRLMRCNSRHQAEAVDMSGPGLGPDLVTGIGTEAELVSRAAGAAEAGVEAAAGTQGIIGTVVGVKVGMIETGDTGTGIVAIIIAGAGTMALIGTGIVSAAEMAAKDATLRGGREGIVVMGEAVTRAVSRTARSLAAERRIGARISSGQVQAPIRHHQSRPPPQMTASSSSNAPAARAVLTMLLLVSASPLVQLLLCPQSPNLLQFARSQLSRLLVLLNSLQKMVLEHLLLV